MDFRKPHRNAFPKLHKQLESKYKPKTPQWLSTKIEDIAKHIPALVFERDRVSVKGPDGGYTSERIIRVTLENGVNGVNGWRVSA